MRDYANKVAQVGAERERERESFAGFTFSIILTYFDCPKLTAVAAAAVVQLGQS